MVWYDTASTLPCDKLKHLGEVLDSLGCPLGEVARDKVKGDRHDYAASTPVGRIWLAVSEGGWSVFFSPSGARRFITLWDWEECMLGKPRPKGRHIPVDESVDWLVGLLKEGKCPEVDLECVERMAAGMGRRVARERWLGPLMTMVSYLAVCGLLVGSVIFDSTSGMVIGTLALVRILAMKVEKIKGKISRRMK
ncbi:hypothetical protein [Arachnia propionica]|uniref:Uncharacterized protein n=1 Tax=Arachnia propionica TaxID=1750 RepID=A0A3P1WWD8_9ACTN|nr:hypothetical protein [Arachnia propionica]RRD49720.1 hypothetical protein EII35_07500 [Arachnia propionica]